jgi:hypothetical protein
VVTTNTPEAHWADGDLRHERRCNSSDQVLRVLKQRELIRAIASLVPANVAECEPCSAGKQKRVPRLAASRATQPGVRLYTELAFYGDGHDRSTALFRMVDDYGGCTWVIPG